MMLRVSPRTVSRARPAASGRWLLLAWLCLLASGTYGCAGSARGNAATAHEPPPAGDARAQDPERGRKSRKANAGEPSAPLAAPEPAVLPPDSSEARWRERIAREPGDAAALTRLSRQLYQQGRHAEAIALLAPVRDGGVKLSAPDRAAVLAGLALHESALGREAEARTLLRMLPDDAAPGVSTFLAVRGTSADTALSATQRALERAPETAALRNNRGIALLRSGDADAAAREFERAIALDPARPGPYYNLAILERFYRLDTAAARRWFQSYWSRSQADPDSLHAELGGTRPGRVAEGGEER